MAAIRRAVALACATPRAVSGTSVRPRNRGGLIPSTWPWRVKMIRVTMVEHSWLHFSITRRAVRSSSERARVHRRIRRQSAAQPSAARCRPHATSPLLPRTCDTAERRTPSSYAEALCRSYSTRCCGTLSREIVIVSHHPAFWSTIRSRPRRQ
jgi:hypothetical protein